MATKIYLRLILLLAAALVLRLDITHRSMGVTNGYTLADIPVRLLDRTGENVPLTRFEIDLLSPDGGEVIQRRYGTNGTTVIWLAAVQSRSDWRVQHPPQICYIAQGWRIEDETPLTLRDRQGRTYGVQRMIVNRDDLRRLVYYFYTDGRHWTSSFLSRVAHAFWSRALRAKTETWVLIQVSTPMHSSEAEPRLAAACLEIFRTAVPPR